MRADEGTIRAGQNFSYYLILELILKYKKYYQNEPKFNGVYLRNNLPKIRDGRYVKNLDEFKSTGTHWAALHVNGHKATYFDSFGVEPTPKNIKKFIGNKNIITNIYRNQGCDSIMCGYFCIGFIDFMILNKSLLDYTIFFSPNDYEKNDKITLKYFQ